MFHMPKTDVNLDPATFDLNLLRYLRALVDSASVTRAGEALGMSQPASSRAVARLRLRFADPLLVRTGHGYVLTPLAEQLAPAVRRALAAADEVLAAATFDPATAQRRLRVAATDYGMSTVLLDLLPTLRKAAPSIGLQIDPWGDDTVAALERGTLDCALFADDLLPPDFHSRRLFEDGYVLMCRRDHPLLAQSLAPAKRLLTAAAAYPQFAARYPGQRGQVTDDVYRRLHLTPAPMAVEAPYFYAGARVVQNSDLVAVLPGRVARLWADATEVVTIPVDIAALRFEYRVIWHERAHRDPGVKWLRELIASQFVTGGAHIVRDQGRT